VTTRNVGNSTRGGGSGCTSAPAVAEFFRRGGWLEGEEKETGDNDDVSNSVVVSIVVIFYGLWRRRINMPAMTTKIQWRFGIGGHLACCCCIS